MTRESERIVALLECIADKLDLLLFQQDTEGATGNTLSSDPLALVKASQPLRPEDPAPTGLYNRLADD